MRHVHNRALVDFRQRLLTAGGDPVLLSPRPPFRLGDLWVLPLSGQQARFLEPAESLVQRAVADQGLCGGP